ncbi:ubiquitin carboxyl-terminal hydrolase, partial [Candidatus Dependentiae bacterium]
LNNLFLNYFLRKSYVSFAISEKLQDWFLHKPIEIIGKYSEIVNVLVVLGSVICGYYLYSFLNYKQYFNGKQNKVTGDKGGLKNLGNTCYINSVLQALFSSKDFIDILNEAKKKNELDKISKSKDNSEVLLSELIALKEKRDNAGKKAVCPQKFVKEVRSILFKNSKVQQDASEFMSLLIGNMNKWDDFKKLFGLIRIECNNCKSCINKYDIHRDPKIVPTNHIAVDITQDKLCDGLKNLKKQEFVSDVLCGTCKKSDTTINKTVEFTDLPNLLVINLNRFSYRSSTIKDSKGNLVFKGESKKINKPMTFPCFGLKINEKDDFEYDLISFVCQAGSLRSGHYISYSKDPSDQKWYKCNDSSRTQVSEDEIKTIAEVDGVKKFFTPYILFYEKNNSKQLGVNN